MATWNGNTKTEHKREQPSPGKYGMTEKKVW